MARTLTFHHTHMIWIPLIIVVYSICCSRWHLGFHTRRRENVSPSQLSLFLIGRGLELVNSVLASTSENIALFKYNLKSYGRLFGGIWTCHAGFGWNAINCLDIFFYADITSNKLLFLSRSNQNCLCISQKLKVIWRFVAVNFNHKFHIGSGQSYADLYGSIICSYVNQWSKA